MFKNLSNSEIEKIRDSTRRIIEDTGFKVEHSEIRRICKKYGAIVDDATNIVRIPSQILDSLLKTVPSSYFIRDRKGRQYTIGMGKRWFHAIVTDPWIIDYKSGKPRRPLLSDIKKNTIVAQSIDDVVAISLMEFPVSDVDERFSILRARQQHLLYHDKHIYVFPASVDSFRQWLSVPRNSRSVPQ